MLLCCNQWPFEFISSQSPAKWFIQVVFNLIQVHEKNQFSMPNTVFSFPIPKQFEILPAAFHIQLMWPDTLEIGGWESSLLISFHQVDFWTAWGLPKITNYVIKILFLHITFVERKQILKVTYPNTFRSTGTQYDIIRRRWNSIVSLCYIICDMSPDNIHTSRLTVRSWKTPQK